MDVWQRLWLWQRRRLRLRPRPRHCESRWILGQQLLVSPPYGWVFSYCWFLCCSLHSGELLKSNRNRRRRCCVTILFWAKATVCWISFSLALSFVVVVEVTNLLKPKKNMKKHKFREFFLWFSSERKILMKNAKI